jgi:hypothetical protein
MAIEANHRSVDNHREAARHHEAAAKHHHEAIKYLEEGRYEDAYQSLLKAHGHHYLAGEAQIENMKRHALE